MNEETTFDVFCPGVLEVLSIGKGDLRLVLSEDNPDDIERARDLIEEMLRKGYSIFVETARGQRRVKRFNPKHMTYVIVDAPDATPPPARDATTEVPVAGTRATAVGRTAGG